jgi:hypothetical protein
MMNLDSLAFIFHVEVTKSDHGVTNENVIYTSYNLSHFVKSRDVQRVVGELTLYDNGTVVYRPRAVGSATQTDVNVVANFVINVVKSNNFLLRVW